MKFTPDETIRIFLGLGSNLGDREAYLREAVRRIEQLGLRISQGSSIYETEPVGDVGQGWFLNQVIEARMTADLDLNLDERIESMLVICQEQGQEATVWAMLADGLLHALHGIERALGRERPFPNAPRTLDIDLLLFADLVLVKDLSSDMPDIDEDYPSSGLIVPHPRMHLRRFVLEPLHEIAPEVIHPSLHKSVADLFAACTDSFAVRHYRSV